MKNNNKIPKSLLNKIQSKTKVSNKDLPSIIDDLLKFHKVVKHIVSEPQVKSVYKTKKVDGKTISIRVNEFNMDEARKILRKHKKIGLLEFFNQVRRSVKENEKSR